jgi:Zn-dependent protease
MLGLIARVGFDDKAIPGTWMDAAMLMGLLCISVLLHELGHCYAARRLDGEANEVLLWPLGGLARVDLPHSPRAHFLTAAAGPAVNLVLCVCCALAMAIVLERPFRPAWNPLPSGWYPYRVTPAGAADLYVWGSAEAITTGNIAAIILARLFYVNWVLFLLNVVLVGFPMDGGRMLQSALWPTVGYRQATLYAVYAGFVCMIALLIACVAMNEIMAVLLAIFIYMACKQEWFLLETGGEDSLFGYDFSQGYTSLEREEGVAAKPQPNFVKRWLQRRAERKRQLEQEQQVAEEIRMDDLLDKIQRHGKESLTEEEHRFLKRVASRYRKKSP